jgi:hypothetical protein
MTPFTRQVAIYFVVFAQVGNIALSLGERVSGDGAFSSRRRTGEGLPPFADHLVLLMLRISYSLPLPVPPAPCGPSEASRIGSGFGIPRRATFCAAQQGLVDDFIEGGFGR